MHQAMPDIMCKLVAKDDANLIPIIQRSLIALQDAKNTYQIKQSLCRLLELISKFEVPFDEQLTVAYAAKEASMCYCFARVHL